MKFKVGDYVFVKDVVRSYSKDFDEYFKKRRKCKILSIHKDETLRCTVCNNSHSPEIMLNISGKKTAWGFTPCELIPSIEEKLNKLMNL